MTCPHCGETNASATGPCSACGRLVEAATSEETVVREAPTLAFTAPPVGGSLRPGHQLGDRYEILSLLGEGGFGAVYKARDRVLERTVALKMIHPALAANPEIMERFKREILLASKITHKNVIRIHDLGESGALKFISMNFVEGRDLKELLRAEGALSVERALGLARQVAEALEAAHEAGVVHRDLKPQNVLVDAAEHAFIVDFGISRSTDAGKTMTEAGAMMGTLAYMSPEQARGDAVDHRSDIYSFGLLMYEMFAGVLPFAEDANLSSLSALMRRVQTDVPSLDRTRAGLPDWISRIVSRCLERDPAGRYPSVGELLRDLDQEQATRAQRALPLKGILRVAAGLLLAVGLAGAAVVLWRGRDSTPTAAAPSTALIVVPFRNSTGDPALDWTRTGLPSLLRSELQQSPALYLVDEERVMGIIDGLKLDGTGSLDPVSLRRLSKLIGVDRLLTGELFRTGGRYRIESRLSTGGASEAGSGVALRVEGEGAEALFTMIDELSRKVVDELGVSAGGQHRRSSELATGSIEALRLYTEGGESARAGSDVEAATRLEAALAVDPQFAIARALLAETYARLGRAAEAIAEAEAAARDLREVSPYEAARVNAVRARLSGDADAAGTAYRELVRLGPGRPDAQLALGTFLEESGDLEGALAALGRAVELDPNSPSARYSLGRAQAKSGNLGAAQQEFHAALGLHVEAGNEEGRAAVLNGLGYVSRQLGRHDEALRYFKESLEVREAIQDRRGVGATYNNIATVLLDLGRYDEATATQQRSVEIYTELGDPIGLASAYANLGEIHDRASRPEDALEAFQSGLDVVRDSGDEASLARAFANLGYIYTVLGRYNEAFFIQKDALATRRKLAEPAEVLDSLVDIGFLEHIQGRYEEALGYFAEGLTLARESGNHVALVALQTNVAAVHNDQGRYGAALASAGEAVEGARRLGDVNLLIPCLADVGSSRGSVGDRAGAESAFAEALELVSKMGGNSTFEATVRTHHGALLLSHGDRPGAATAFRQARAAAEASRDQRLLLFARLGVGEAERSARELEEVAGEARSRRLKPVEVQARLALARLRLDERQFGQASEDAELTIREATPLAQRDVLFEAHYLALRAVEGRGDAEAALRHAVAALGILEELRRDVEGTFRQLLLARPRTQAFADAARPLFEKRGLSAETARLRSALAP